MAKDPEIEHPVGETEPGGSARANPSKRAETPISFLEELMTLFKLRFLRQKLELTDVDQATFNELETKVQSGSADEQAEAKSTINTLFGKLAQVDYATKPDSSLTEILQAGGENNTDLLQRAVGADIKLADLKEQGPDADKAAVEDAIEETKGLAVDMGINLEEGKKRDVEKRLDIEIAMLHELRDRASLAEQRELLQGLSSAAERERSIHIKKGILESEDFKEPTEREDERRIFKARKKRHQKTNQDEVDKTIDRTKKDLEGDNLQRIRDEELLKGYLDWRTQGSRSLSFVEGFEGANEPLIESLKIASIYAEEYADRVADAYAKSARVLTTAELEARKAATKLQVMGIFEEAWKKHGPLQLDELEEMLHETAGPDKKQELEDLARMLGGRSKRGRDSDPISMMGGRGAAQQAEVLVERLRQKGVDMGRVSRAFSEKKRDFDRRGIKGAEHKTVFGEEFMEDLTRMYPDLDEPTYRMIYEGATGLFGNEHYANLQERVNNGDYEGYLKDLMSYLYKVGLREGRQDFQLQILQREARTILATVGRSDLLEIYEAYERTATFHDSYFQLDAEGYAKELTYWGVDSLQVFKNKEANTLIVTAENSEGVELGNMSFVKFDDMMQERAWAHRLIYDDKDGFYDEEHVYDDMIVTQLYGDENNVCRIQDGEVINIVTGNVVASLDDRLIVDRDPDNPQDQGTEMSLESFIQDNRYMVGIAHDMWRLNGRIANILDDVQVGSAKGANKELLTTWKIRRYAEEYGFIPTWMMEALSLDNFIYEIENYKDLVGAGMKKLFKGRGTNGEAASKLINKHIKRVRVLRGQEFRTNYLPIEDVRLLSRNGMTFDDARIEYLRRERLMGHDIDWDALSDSDRETYSRQIELFHKKWSDNIFTNDERAIIDGVDWASVNAQYSEILGVESIGDTYEDFIANFSFGRLSATEKFRGTDLKDYGGYFLKSHDVTSIFKGGFGGGATEAIAKIFGTMEGYLPYDSSGFRDFSKKLMEVMYSWDDRRWSTEVPKEKVVDGKVDGKVDGVTLPNGEIMTDENGYWVTKKETKMLYGQSLLQKTRMRTPRNERDIEYAVYSMVGSGTLDRETAEEFLDQRYGGIFKGSKYTARSWRWLKRYLWLDDSAIFWEAAWADGKKAVGGTLKYIFG